MKKTGLILLLVILSVFIFTNTAFATEAEEASSFGWISIIPPFWL